MKYKQKRKKKKYILTKYGEFFKKIGNNVSLCVKLIQHL